MSLKFLTTTKDGKNKIILTQDNDTKISKALRVDYEPPKEKYVTLDGKETITGLKTFDNDVYCQEKIRFIKTGNPLLDFPTPSNEHFYIQAFSNQMALGPTSSIATVWDLQGNMTVLGPQITAPKFVKKDGKSTEILMADGSVQTLDKFTVSLATNDVLEYNAENQLSTNYSITSGTSIGGITQGQQISGNIKEVLDMILGSPLTMSLLTYSNATYEYGEEIPLNSVLVKVDQGTAKSLDKLEITLGSNIKTTETVVDKQNTINTPGWKITGNNRTLEAKLTYDVNKTKTDSSTYYFSWRRYCGAMAKETTITANSVKNLSNKPLTGNQFTIILNKECSVIAHPDKINIIKDENGYNVTDSFSETTLDITNQHGATHTYHVYKLKTPVTATKTYTVS